jgi:hypothetical protein
MGILINRLSVRQQHPITQPEWPPVTVTVETAQLRDLVRTLSQMSDPRVVSVAAELSELMYQGNRATWR